MPSSPVPVVVCSGLIGPRAEAAVRALEMGAVDIITKPKIGIRGFLEESTVMLEDTVRAAATARVRNMRTRRRHLSYRNADVVLPPAAFAAPSPAQEKLIVIGASTGGTEALLYFRAHARRLPGVVAEQHMPEGFTAAYANASAASAHESSRSCRRRQSRPR